MRKAILLLFIMISYNLYSNEAVIDQFIQNSDLDGLKVYMGSNAGSPLYSVIESIVLDRAKKLIFAKDYQTAQSLLSLILDVNFENFEAQDIFISIQDLIREQAEIERQRIAMEEQRQLEELEKQKDEAEAQRAVEISTIDGKNFIFQCEFGAINFNYMQSGFNTNFYNEQKNNIKYGIDFLMAFYFHHPYIATGISFYLDTYFVDLYDTSSIPVNYKILFEITTPIIVVPLYLRVGFGQVVFYFKEDQTPDMLVQNFYSPVLGIQMKDFYFNEFVGISGYCDIYLISLFTSHFDIALDLNLGVLVRVLDIEPVTLYLRTEALLYLLAGYEKMENNLKIQMSLGMKINEK